MTMTLEEKYGIVYIDGKRYYSEDLTQRNYSVENSTPFSFFYSDGDHVVDVKDNTWNNMIYKIAVAFDEFIPKSEEEYLGVQNDWGKQKVFSREKLKNYLAFKDIYINLNHTAIHALWTIQILLDFYGIDRASCQMLLRRHGSAEPKEAQAYFQNKTLEGFDCYLQEIRGYSQEKSKKIINNLTVANKLMPKISRSYDNLFLFEDGSMLSGYGKKLLEVLKFEKGLSNEQLDIIRMCVDLLAKYYSYANKVAKQNKK